MKGAMKKRHQIKRVIAWLLTIAIVAGNVSQLNATTVYAAESTAQRTATPSSASKASPSEATPSQAKQVIDVKVTQSAIEKVLKKDIDSRPELKEDLIPFKGEQKDLVIEKLYEELDGKTLIFQKKSGKAMYLVVVSDVLDGEPFSQYDESDRIKQEALLQNVHIIGVNGYKDRECEFRLRIVSDNFVVTDAQLDEYAVVGENTEDTITNKSGGSASVGGTAAGTQAETAAETNAETNAETQIETTAETAVESQEAVTESDIKNDSDVETLETDDFTSTEKDTEAAETKEKENKISETESDDVKTEQSEQEKAEVQEQDGNNTVDSESEKTENLQVSISRHQVPVLSEALETATPSEVVSQPESFDSADIVSVGNGHVLSGEEKSALMGIDGEEVEKSFSLTSLFTQPSYSMVVPSFGITLLNMEVSDEAKLSPYETALSYYGEDSTDRKDTVEINLDQSMTGEIKAGKLFTYTITYTMQAAPLYEYAAGGKLSLFDTYENAVIYFTVPSGIKLEEQSGKVELSTSDSEKSVYAIQVGDGNHSIQPGKSDNIVINAYIDENGKRAVGEKFALSENSVEFHADVKVADKTDIGNVTYPGNIPTVTYAKQPSQTQLQLISDDEWHIKKSVYPTDHSYTIVKDDAGNPQYVDITYMIEVGMYGNQGVISTQPSGTIYQTYGRTGFEDNSFHITDTLSITTPNAPAGMKPISVSAAWGDEKSLPFRQNGDGSIIIDDFKTQGQNEADDIYVSDSAPTYSSYLVTARYPYEPFILKYNDPRVKDSSVFTVLNQAHLEYIKLGTSQVMKDDSEAAVAVHEVNKPAVIQITKLLDEGIGVLKPYDLNMEKEYPGSSEFEIYSVDSQGNETPYDNYTVLDPNGKSLVKGTIAVNPSNETDEDIPYTTGSRGYIQIQADPGTYVIKEGRKPTGTEYSYAVVDSNTFRDSQEIKFSIKAGENKEVKIINNVVGKGAIEFYKKARTWNSVDTNETDLSPLRGAEFTLYQKIDGTLSEVTTVKSDGNGLVRFKPVTPGDYIVREKSAGGYIIDTQDYPVTVKKGETSVLKEGNNYLVNTLNKAKVQVTKLLQRDDGTYGAVPSQYRGDFNKHFWFESSVDGSIWIKVSVNSPKTYSLDRNSGFKAELPVYDSGNHLIRYRVVEQIPDRYSDGNSEGDGVTTEIKDNKIYLYKEFTLVPLKTTSVQLKNNRQGLLKLQKETWTFNGGQINMKSSNAEFQFKLYEADKHRNNYTEVTPGKNYVTDKNGIIIADNLDINKDYYWSEENSSDRLEAEEDGKTIDNVLINGVNTSLIGPYTVSRQSDTRVKAYNIPQKVPYWLHKYDITDDNKVITATFRITKKTDGAEVFNGTVSKDGTFVTLDPGTTYLAEEIQTPAKYVGTEIREFSTPNGPINREQLKDWFANESTITHLKFYNKPYKTVDLKKIKYNPDGSEDSDIKISFEVYQKNEENFTPVTLPNNSNKIVSNTDTEIAPGTYYFKEIIGSDIINPLFLMSKKADGTYDDYIIQNGMVYYGPATVTPAEKASDKKMDLFLNGSNALVNYQNYGRVTVTKLDALRNTPVKGAEFGIYLKSQFREADWANSIKNPILKATSGTNGKATFSSSKLRIFDDSGNRIPYVIAEITAPSGYLPSNEVLTTTLTEGKTISTVNGETSGAPLIIKDEPKLTIRTQKYWRDSWNDQFHEVNQALGNVNLALYKVKRDQPETADLVTVQVTNEFDGIATFNDIDRNDTYYVAEVRVPTRSESKLPFELNMGNKEPLPLESGQPARSLSVADLKERYNAVSFSGKDLPGNVESLVRYTDPLFNYKSWVQFNIWKTCDGITFGGGTHDIHMVNGARFTLYKMLSDTKNLSSVKLEDFTDEGKFETEGQYESGTRIDPETGKRLDGQLDTTILDDGYVYWLVEDKAAPGYTLDEGGKIAAVFVPDNSGYRGYNEIRHPYQSGRNEKIAVIVNQHSNGGTGLENYHFQVALNKWLEITKDNYTLLGGAKFKLWLLNPVNNEKLLPIDVVETGLESDSIHKTGYALTKIIRLDELSDQITTMGKNPKDFLQYNTEGEPVKLSLGLEEIYAPSKVNLDSTLHVLEVTVPINKDYIDDQYFWDDSKSDQNYRLINQVSKEYPVTIKKYGYIPDSSTFYKTDDELDSMNIQKSPLPGVKFEVWRYQWKTVNDKYMYEYEKYGTYTTEGSGNIEIPGGLPSGLYRMKEILTTQQQNQYITMYNGAGALWRDFTVASSSLTVPVYNPQKPMLEIEKTAWNGEKPEGLSGITFTLKTPSGGTDTAVTQKQEDGRYLAVLDGLESGTYTITGETLGSNAKKTTADNYFEPTSISVGYKPVADGNKVTLVPVADGINGQLAALTIRNPRLAQLTLHKTDGESKQSDAAMKGAEFRLEYMKFRTDTDLDGGTLKNVEDPAYEKPSEGFSPISSTLEDLKDGSYVLKNCQPGWYRITEIKAPEGYTVDTAPMVVAVTGDMTGIYKNTEVTFENREKVTLTITKNLYFGDGFINDQDIKEKLPSQVVFDVFTYSDAEKAYKPVYDDNHQPVTVTIHNFEAADGYYTAEGKVLLAQYPEGGAYYVKERENPDWVLTGETGVTNAKLWSDGYIQVGTVSDFTTKTPVAIGIDNQYAKARIRIIKVDAADHSKKLTGAEFRLYSDQTLASYVGDFKEIGTSGVYEFDLSTRKYSPGTYYVKETNAPVGYLTIGTAIPEQGLTAETGKTTEITVENQGGIDFQITKYSGDGKTEAVKAGMTFELYKRVEGNTWNYVTEGKTDTHGELSFRGLKQETGYSYGLYEVPDKDHGFDTYRIEKFEGENGNILPVTADLVKNGDTRPGLDLYVLSGDDTKAPGVYQFTVHNQEALPLKLFKNDVNKQDNPSGSIHASIKVTNKETGKQVGEIITVPYGETGTTVMLLPGVYELEETAITPNADGYVINPDDSRTVYKKEVNIEKGTVPPPCEFTNVKQKTGVSLEKTTQTASLKDLWWNDGQMVTYTLTPGAINTIPLDQYEVTDQGLTMLDSGKNALDETEYSDEKYTIVSVKPGKAAQLNRLKEGNTGTILADVTFYGFDGNQAGEVQTVSVSGDGEIGEIKPVGEKLVKSFKISYRDDTLKKSTNHAYTLGQDFVPGTITVTAKLNRQDATLKDGSYKKDIKYIRNKADVTMKYRKWDVNGNLNSGQESSLAEALCDITVIQSQAPIMAVSKNVNPVKGVQPGDTLTYTLTVNNTTTSSDSQIAPIQKPVLIDLVPLGVTVSGETSGEDRLLTAVAVESGPAGVSIDKTVRKVDPETGRETLFIRLNGNLKKGESVTVSVKAKIAGNIINYGKNILNTLFVTSDVLQPAFSLNHTGASFMIQTSSGIKWPSNDLPAAALLPDENYRSYGYVSDSAENTMSTGTGIQLYKEVKGNLDTRFVSGTTAGKVAKSAEDTDLTKYDGSVLYRLMVNNASAQDYVSQLQLMDIMPVKGDYSTSKFERLSDFRLKYDSIQSIEIENRKDNGESGRKVRDFDYEITYSDQTFDSKEMASAAKNAMLADNTSDFWSDGSSDPTAIRIKITDPEFHLAPGENLVVTYKTVVPYNKAQELEDVAYGYAVNDFATAFSYKESGLESEEKKFSQAQTSNSVQVLLVPGNVKVSGRVWIDDDNNGIQNESVENDHLLTDLFPLLQSGYFRVSLQKYSKNGDDQTSMEPGAADARFLFDDLTPAKPYGLTGTDFTESDEDNWYSGGSLRLTSLKGDDPAHYQIELSKGAMPKGFEDLVLKLAKPNMLPDGENKKAGRSRLPKTLLEGRANYDESRDSNFNETKNGYSSEDFFLWSTAGDYDTTKDIGFVPYRKVTVKKINKAQNPVEGAHFTVYGPFTNEEMEAFNRTPITDPAVLGSPEAEGMTTLTDGEAVWNAGELLYYRNYIITEDGAPAGYQLDQAVSGDMVTMDSYKVQGHKAWILKSKEFKTEAQPIPSTVTVEDSYITGSLEFIKLDGLTRNKLAGATFEIKKQVDVVKDAWSALIASMKKDSISMGITDVNETEKGVRFKITDGLVKITGIPLGSYTLSELQVPDGYDISGKPEESGFVISSQGQQAQLSKIEGNVIENTRTEYSLSIKKADNAGNAAVKGISFSISGPGTYESSTWNPFSRNKFKINDPDHTGYEIKQTGDEGVVTWNLPYGDYEITELSAPGYHTIEPFYVRIGQDGTVSLLNGEDRPELVLKSQAQKEINVVVTNQIQTAPITIEKMDEESKNLITGAWFELSGTSLVKGAFETYLENVTGIGVSSVTTKNDGGNLSVSFRIDGLGDSRQAILTRVPYGTYTLKEIQAPAGYLFGGSYGFTKELLLDKPEGISFTGDKAVINTPHKLTIEKRDKSTNALLSNAVFVLMTADGKYVSLDDNNSYTGLTDKNEEATSFTTGSDGTVTVKRLPSGNYVLKEIKAPENYRVSADTDVTVLETGNTDKIKVYDVRDRAKIRINKAAAHNHETHLSGAVFEIYSDNSLTALADTVTTGNDGTGESKMLPLGTYYVKEKTAPDGYEASSRVYEVTLKEDSETSTVTSDGSQFIFNDYGTGNLTFDKVDGVTEKLLPAAEFSLTEKTVQVEGAFEDFTEKLLKAGVEELDAMGITDVKKSGDSIRFTAFNGHVDMGNIPYGTYTLKEEKAPEGYLSLSSEAEFDFTITADHKSAVLSTDNKVVNDRAQFTIKLKKTDNLKRSISGIKFHILGPGKYEENGILTVFGSSRFHTQPDAGSGTFVTGDDGGLSLGLKYGDYQIREDASDRYDSIEPFYIRVDEKGVVSILKDNSKAVSVDNESEKTITVTNQISTGSMSLEKVDSEDTNKRLEGAEFTLTNLSTMVPGAWDSYRSLAASKGAAWTQENVKGNTITFTLAGKAEITNLPYGTYRITETKAPDGYLLGTQPWSRDFTLSQSETSELFVKPSFFEKTKGAVENQPSKVTVVKTNAVYADIRLEGAEFIMKNSGGSYVKLNGGSFAGYTVNEKEASRFKTDSSGQFIIKRLPADTYVIKETRAPSGYRINYSIPPLTLDGINSFTITIQDERIRGGGGNDDGPTPRPTQSTVTIIPDPVPLANMPGDNQIDFVTIDDGNVPLAKLPKTGERKSNAGKVMVALSGFMLALYAALNKKKKSEK
ncbi:doubled motif LPXTG anchor domain-containing protein [Clostridium boliviensis]|uniref:Doubled motif LPXTG anchor domain-containing protein n=1 Tax=Clostridium boliviensis TaxID=318465 RepID=A0ABU4GU00_9CLOT|nr:doubled motif LPXTG anchor domain-containing protein [Clostridium boliviensis]MDW2800467.1 doubled motif LPXTG anchor domain-containing protein [Clostridium boliviensis]